MQPDSEHPGYFSAFDGKDVIRSMQSVCCPEPTNFRFTYSGSSIKSYQPVARAFFILRSSVGWQCCIRSPGLITAGSELGQIAADFYNLSAFICRFRHVRADGWPVSVMLLLVAYSTFRHPV